MTENRRREQTQTPSEIASWVYCPEQWRLEQGLGLPPAKRDEHTAGTQHHAHKATAERVAGGSIALGRLLILVALLALAVLWWLAQ